ncbi:MULTISPECIES: hypothetical protein [unclassified Streptomyces]|uniref:hypothetical protein n=1 Tax=unclassified Streptomyces TaxID=2593676 RepID=UPI00288843B1|nr:hypothetical protein [Streptomyces sp. DSM 41633]
MARIGSFGHEEHDWLGKTVRDIASGTEGKLTAVVNEEKHDHLGRATRVRLAYIKKTDGRELPTAVTNIELAADPSPLD